jgi:hypothetical protein
MLGFDQVDIKVNSGGAGKDDGILEALKALR